MVVERAEEWEQEGRKVERVSKMVWRGEDPDLEG